MEVQQFLSLLKVLGPKRNNKFNFIPKGQLGLKLILADSKVKKLALQGCIQNVLAFTLILKS